MPAAQRYLPHSAWPFKAACRLYRFRCLVKVTAEQMVEDKGALPCPLTARQAGSRKGFAVEVFRFSIQQSWFSRILTGHGEGTALGPLLSGEQLHCQVGRRREASKAR